MILSVKVRQNKIRVPTEAHGAAPRHDGGALVWEEGESTKQQTVPHEDGPDPQLEETLKAMKTRTELEEKQHQSEIEDLKLQVQQMQESIEALNEQLKSVLEENVSLQKQLIKAENKLLSSRLKKMPDMQDGGQQTVPEDLNVKRHTIQEGNGANVQQESYRSLIARNERLLRQLEEALMSRLLQMKNVPLIDI